MPDETAANPPQQPTQPKPWDRLPTETDSSYYAFMVYLYQGPHRSVSAAFTSYRRMDDSANLTEYGVPPKLHSGQWNEWCRVNGWQRRAQAWDLHMIKLRGEKFVTTMIAIYEAASQRIYEAILDPKTKPKDWTEMMATLQQLTNHLPSNFINEVMDDKSE